MSVMIFGTVIHGHARAPTHAHARMPMHACACTHTFIGFNRYMCMHTRLGRRYIHPLISLIQQGI